MAIESISVQEFEALGPARGPMAKAIGEEVKWFGDTARNLLGVVIRDRTDNDWGYVVLRRDERETFRAVELETSLVSEEDAERDYNASYRELGADRLSAGRLSRWVRAPSAGSAC